MKLAFSNIAWAKESDDFVYSILADNGFDLEFAPTRLFPNPYNNVESAKKYFSELFCRHKIKPVSMQSIWYGLDDRICSDRFDFLLDYTKKAVDFAAAAGCRNIVFGCPKNRTITHESDCAVLEKFFVQAAEYASKANCVLALEPNPVIYGTNFANTTEDAVQFVKKLNQNGLQINLDCGTIIYNNENLDIIEKNIDLISHVHISEPYLVTPHTRDTHKKVLGILCANKYKNYISVEMKNCGEIDTVKDTVKYVRSLLDGI